MGEPLIQALDEQPIDAVIWEKAALIAGLAVSIFFYHFTRLFVRREGGEWPSTLLHVAAVAMAEEEFDAEAMALEAMEDRGPAPEAAGWKSYGRWQLMASRMAMQSRRATRRGR